MPGMKFRRSCDRCNATFFSTDRKARFCPKHQPRPNAEPVPAPRPRLPEPSPPPPAFQARAPFQKSNKFVAGNKPRPSGPSRPPKEKSAPKAPRPPQASDLTPELRAQIASTFQTLQNVPGTDTPLDSTLAELNLRNIHTQISQQLWVKRALVAHVLREIRSAITVTTVDLTPEQYQQATTRYAYFVETGARPEGGRRRTIAQELGVPTQSVVLAVRKWAQERYAQSPTPQPTRKQLFEIEKCYWRHMDHGETSYDELPDVISAELGFVTPYQVLRWVDVLHDDTKLKNSLPEITPEQRRQVMEAYQEYLKGETHPEHALHPTIARKLGILAGQVHQVLYDYRVERRASYRQQVSVGTN